MKSRLYEKERINITLETDNGYKYSNRDGTFITSCVNELKKKKETICFQEWHIKEIQKHLDIEYTYDNNDNCYYVKLKK